MMKFWDAHEKQRDKFAVIAIHNPDKRADSFEKLDKLLDEKGILKKWGKNLPFTVILDNSGETVKAYGIEAYPTTLLIDPEGKIVRGGSEKMLEEKLAELARDAK